jgi:hypothetical protein
MGQANFPHGSVDFRQLCPTEYKKISVAVVINAAGR